MSPRRITTTVRIGGRIVPAHTIKTDHGVNRPVGTASVTISAPRPSYVQTGVTVTIHAGFDGAAWPIFAGYVGDDNSVFDDGGGVVRVECVGYASRLYYKMHQNLGFVGPLRLDTLFRSVCHWKGVPSYLADGTTAPDGMSNIMIGSNPDIRNGWIPMDKGKTPGAELDRYARLYGYRMFDTPRGPLRLRRISGSPAAYVAGMPLYQQGVNVLSIERDRSYDDMANYWEVLGAQYQAADTSEVAIRSIPSTVTANPIFGPEGVAQQTIRDESLVTETLARACRNAHEIDYGAPAEIWRWRTTGQPERQPGEAVGVLAPTARGWDGEGTIADAMRHTPRAVWLMRVAHTITDAGWTTDMEGWAGNGQQLPAGNDCVVQSLLGSEGRHLGNEWLAHYRRPNPDGLQVDIPFSVADDYSTLTIRAIAHGVNSFVGNQQTEVSRFEIWQTWHQPDRAVASGDMPRVDERLEQRLPYGPNDAHWQQIVIPLTGSLKAGSAFLRIISEMDNAVGDYDDFEVANIQLTTCGIGEPVIIG